MGGERTIKRNNSPFNSRKVFVLSMAVIVLLAAANIVVHFIRPQDYREYALSAYLVFHWNEWFRLITYMFIHSNTEHLLFNVVALLAVGQYAAKVRGPFFILAVYFAGGIMAGLVSICYSWYITENTGVFTVGASGAVFCLMGASFLAVFLTGRANLIALIFGAAAALYGSSGENVDSAAHIGGFVTGVILGAVLYIPQLIAAVQTKRLKEDLKRFRRYKKDY